MGIAISQDLAAESLKITHGVLPIGKKQSIYRPHVIAALFAEIAEDVVLHGNSVAVVPFEALAQLFRLERVIAVTASHTAVEHNGYRATRPFRSHVSPGCVPIYSNVHLIGLDRDLVRE